VHAFSGVPNRAFVLAAEAFGGYCWEKVGRIWWTVLKEKRIPTTCTFAQLSDATTAAAQELFGGNAATIVKKAWDDVGVQSATKAL
jgi:Zn-dependent metalloprotease